MNECKECGVKSSVIEILHEKVLDLESQIDDLKKTLSESADTIQKYRRDQNEVAIRAAAINAAGRAMHLTVDKIATIMGDNGHPIDYIYRVEMDYRHAAALILLLKGAVMENLNFPRARL